MNDERDIHRRSLQAVQENPDSAAWDAAVREHVSGCERCRRTAEASGLLRQRLGAAHRGTAPASLVASLRETLAVEDRGAAPMPRASRPSAPAPLPRWLRLAVPAALAAGLALGIGIAPLLDRIGGPGGEVPATMSLYLQDVTHDRYLLERMGQPLEQHSEDRGGLSGWLSEGLGLSVDLPEAPGGWSLQGGRIWHTVSRLSALASYAGPGDQRIVVFAVPAENIALEHSRIVDLPSGRFYLGEGWGHAGVAWVDGELAWSAVAPIEETVLLEWSAAYRRP